MSRSVSHKLQRPGLHKAERVLWWFTFVWGGSIIWLAHRPPMVDLAAHAGQIELLRGLIAGGSPWKDVFFVNPLTPYLLGYFIATLFSFAMPVLVAVKLTISVAYFAFVLSAVKVSRYFRSSHYLDWTILPVFFGLPFVWGYLPFLTAAPVGLFFLISIDYYICKPTKYGAWWPIMIGLLLLASHGLTFAFFYLTAFAMIVVKCRKDDVRRLATALIPLFSLGGMTLIVIWIIKEREVQFGQPITSFIMFNYHWGRMHEMLINSFDSYLSVINDRYYDWPLLIVACLFVVAPWWIGLKCVNCNRSVAMVPFVIVLAALTLVPTSVAGASLVSERFAIFLFPSYAWVFSTKITANKPAWCVSSGVIILILGCYFAMGVRTVRTLHFDQESAGFSKVLDSLAPAQIVLYLPFDRASVANSHEYTYEHFASWYEAELHGLVEPNWAAYSQNMVVRFRDIHRTTGSIDRDPSSFNWDTHLGDQYRYFIIRDKAEKDASSYFKGALCLPKRLLSTGEWKVYERGVCDGTEE